MTSSARTFRRTLRVVYPLTEGRIALRTELDWNRDVEPDTPEDAGNTFTFTIQSSKPFPTSSRSSASATPSTGLREPIASS